MTELQSLLLVWPVKTGRFSEPYQRSMLHSIPLSLSVYCCMVQISIVQFNAALCIYSMRQLFLSQIVGFTLPYDELTELRERINEVAPHLTRYDHIEPANFFALTQKLMKVSVLLSIQQSLNHHYETHTHTVH